MKAELSYLFGLDWSGALLTEVHIGSGVQLQEIASNNWAKNLFTTLSASHYSKTRKRLSAREDLSWHPYNHRFYFSLDNIGGLDDPQINNAHQLIMRAIVLSKIVRPNPIPLHCTWVLIENPNAEDEFIKVWTGADFHSTAYVLNPEQNQILTQADVEVISECWPSLQHFFADKKTYQRIIRALLYFNDAHHILPRELCHITLHAALESLICVNSRNNKRQVTKRLPKLIQGISEQDAIEIYQFCVDAKHTAAPTLLYSTDINNLDQRDISRLQATQKLAVALRSLFIKALKDRSFANVLADPTLLESQYGV